MQDVLKSSPGGRLPESRVKKWATQIAEALAYAHKRGVVHRDIKPANILIDSDDNARLADFGLAKAIGEEFIMTQIHQSIQQSMTGRSLGDAPTIADPAMAYRKLSDSEQTLNYAETLEDGGSNRTTAESILGTYDYMAPEQRGELDGKMDARTDIYSFGVMLYRILTGRRPVGRAKTVSATVPGLSKNWDIITDRCLEHVPADRYADGEELLMALQRGKMGGGFLKNFKKLFKAAIFLTILTGLAWGYQQYTAYQINLAETAREPIADVHKTEGQRINDNPRLFEEKAREFKAAELAKRDSEKRRKIMGLLISTRSHFAAKEYELAETALADVLRLDNQNAEAILLQDQIRKAIAREQERAEQREKEHQSLGRKVDRYEGVIVGQNVYVCATPSLNSYPVAKLNEPQTVTVTGKPTEDWLEILPAKGCYSVIGKQYVEVLANGKGGKVTSNGVYIRAAGQLRQRNFFASQGELNQGDLVRIIGTASDDSGQWYIIRPPAAVRFYVSSRFVKPASQYQQDKDAVTASSSKSATVGPIIKVDNPTVRKEAQTLRQIRKLQRDLAAESKKPLAKRDYQALLTKAEKISVPKASRFSPIHQALLGYIREEIDRQASPAASTNQGDRSTPLRGKQKKYDLQGVLQVSELFNTPGQRRFLVRDPKTYNILGYVQDTTGTIPLQDYVGKTIGIVGNVAVDKKKSLMICDAYVVNALDANKPEPRAPEVITPQPAIPGLIKPEPKPELVNELTDSGLMLKGPRPLRNNNQPIMGSSGLDYFKHNFKYTPVTKEEITASELILKLRRDMLPDAAKLCLDWNKTFGYKFDIRDFHLLSRLARDPLIIDKMRLIPPTDIITILRRRKHIPHATANNLVSDDKDTFTNQLKKLSRADLWNIYLLNEMLLRPRVRASLRLMADGDLADIHSAWGGLIFYQNGQAEAVLYPPDTQAGANDQMYQATRRLTTDGMDSLCRLTGHFDKIHNADRAGPSEEELAQAKSQNFYGLILTRLNRNSFCAHYYNPAGVVVSLGNFQLR